MTYLCPRPVLGYHFLPSLLRSVFNGARQRHKSSLPANGPGLRRRAACGSALSGFRSTPPLRPRGPSAPRAMTYTAPRSGLAAKHFIDVGAGVIDEDYRGNVGVVLFNFGKEKFEVKKGDRIAQLICERIFYPEIEEVQVWVIQMECFWSWQLSWPPSSWKHRMSRSKHKSSGDVAGTAKKCQVLEAQRKDEERQEKEEVPEGLKRCMTQEMAGDFLYLRRHC
ncbi:deoxyuridine 5'-triphosphate nucleotidohydrolase, mitochondrial isoform X9 [Physeter macrocephalus]|uniref:Deoxyuridine 5'-triphosphate nucleotidohydrolase n=1 Tax=Physeter macrocephalus TaxID=9755 RepID=A0A9W2WYD8_PHYMC|nr:deoxyuridine 5'-triphosphate nucleotidohydrolase, mitochondrial isoform X9 [Physeter catodon]